MKTVGRTERAHGRIIVDFDVTGQGRGVGEDRPRADVAIVRNVGIGHQQRRVADGGDAAATGRAPVDGDELPEGVAVADLEEGLLAGVLQILGSGADGTMALEAVSRPDGGPPGDPTVGTDETVAADDDVTVDDDVRFDHHAVSELGPRIDDCGWVNLRCHHCSIIADIMSASHATSPSTVAIPWILAKVRLTDLTSMSKTIWSPGTTGRRNRQLSIPVK